MKEVESIKALFRPIQPSVKRMDQHISYEEFKPSSPLENYIYCYWRLKTKTKLDAPFSYRVVSDGCIDIFFDLENPSSNFIMGFCRKYKAFDIGKEFDFYGIRFFPSCFPLVFEKNAKELSNKSQELKLVLPGFSKYLSSLDQSQNISSLLDVKIEALIKNKDLKIDTRFYNGLNKILEKKGFLDIEKDLNIGLSPRQLRRIFNFYIGTTPKAFSNVVRFQHILNAKPSNQSLKENKLYYDLGFYDQAHFIKSFKSFYGVTPTQAFE